MHNVLSAKGGKMRRRTITTLLGGAAVGCAVPAAAQQSPMPVVGILSSSSAEAPAGRIDAIEVALRQAGYVVGQTVRIEYRYGDNRPERLPRLAEELVALPANVIMTSGGPGPIFAAKAETTTIPIVFAPLSDPVQLGVVASLNRPGGNITGIAALTIELDPKRLELLNELVPAKGPFGILFNPARPDSRQQLAAIESAANSVGRELHLVPSSAPPDIEGALGSLARHSVVGVLVAADAFFAGQHKRIVSAMATHGLPAIYQWREFVDAGGLASYGPSLFESYRQAGILAARILKGEKPGNLPVQQPTKFELVLNVKMARSLGLTVPLALLGRADVVVE
ncbi:ABC transporter substrate-binding protein [Reyranella sp.]|uniref:ABC transporter substrate-binding protein n=1 Tax=Reyranella sp. TaxID=1929291 RepID=UPI0037838229